MEGEVLGSRVWRRTWEGESSGRRTERAGTVTESLGLRERDLNAVGPKTYQVGLDRSDRSPIPVRPVRAELAQADRNNLGALSRGLKLMTVINLIN